VIPSFFCMFETTGWIDPEVANQGARATLGLAWDARTREELWREAEVWSEHELDGN